MGRNRKHHHDVCRVHQRLYREKRAAGLDKFYDADGFLLFYGRDPDQQSHDFPGREIIWERRMIRYRKLVVATVLLGLVFVLLQWLGFRHLWISGITFHGSGAGQFLYIIAGLHAVHVIGGIIALFVLWVRARNARIRSYNVVPVDVVSTYWHFVDLLWIYLFIFFLMVQ